jgi:hypothetical protein
MVFGFAGAFIPETYSPKLSHQHKQKGTRRVNWLKFATLSILQLPLREELLVKY